MISIIQCISLFVALSEAPNVQKLLTLTEYVRGQIIESKFEIPYVEDMPGVVDARLFNGRMKMQSAMDSGGVLFFVDINNLKKINEIFGREVGDLYVKSTIQAISVVIRNNGQIFRLGGDEFAIVHSSISPLGIQWLTMKIEDAVRKITKKVLTPSVLNAGKKQIEKLKNITDETKRSEITDDFINEIGRYGKASVSVGAAYINPLQQNKTQEKAEDRAKKRKIEIKLAAGLSVAKYNSPIQADLEKKPRFKLDSLPELIAFEFYPPIQTLKIETAHPTIVDHPSSQGYLVIFESKDLEIVEAFDYLHRSTFWIIQKNVERAKPEILHKSAVTQLPSIISKSGQDFDTYFKRVNKSPRARIEFKMAGLLYFNYMKDGVESGDRALKLFGHVLQEAIKQELKNHLRSMDIVFSGHGSDFIVYLTDVSEFAAISIQQRILKSISQSHRIRELLEKEFKALEEDPETRDLIPKLRDYLDPTKIIESNSTQFQYWPS